LQSWLGFAAALAVIVAIKVHDGGIRITQLHPPASPNTQRRSCDGSGNHGNQVRRGFR
jgi:hypothetical protein